MSGSSPPLQAAPLWVYGEDGYGAVEGLGGSYGTERARLGRRDFTAPFEETVVEYRGDDSSWQREWHAFWLAVGDGWCSSGSVDDAFEALRLASAIYESDRTGRLATP